MDRSGQLEAELTRNATDIPGILPRYDGLGLCNLPSTLLSILGLAPGGNPGLRGDLVPPDLAEGVERVVLLLIDGLGHLQLKAAVAAGHAPNIGRMMEEGAYLPITSVLPSTTATALATLCTALAPEEHGIMGYRLYLREYGYVANMIHLAPVSGLGSLPEAGVDVGGLIPGPTVFERLRAAGVTPYVLTRHPLVGTPFSAMLHRGAQVVGHIGAPDMFVHLRRLLGPGHGGRIFAFAYWDEVDIAGHAYGAASEEHSSQLAAMDFSLGRELLDRGGDGRTLLVVTADHGHIDVPAHRNEWLDDHPDLLRMLRVEPTGDARLVYLHARPGLEGEVRAYAERSLGQKGVVLATARAFREGLFGRGRPRPEAVERAGDLLLIPRQDWAFPFRYGPAEAPLIGRHGGPSRAEMLVPLLLHRL